MLIGIYKLVSHTQQLFTANTQPRPMSTLPELRYIFHHVFLPPQLPQSDDNGAANDGILARMMLESAEEFSRASLLNYHVLSDSWGLVPTMLRSLRNLFNTAPLDADELYRELRDLNAGGECPLITPHEESIDP